MKILLNEMEKKRMAHLFDERHYVEEPFIGQLKTLGWQHIEGDIYVPDYTERSSFSEVMLEQRLRESIRKINLDEHGSPWLDDTRVSQAVNTLTRLGAYKLMEANEAATDLLLRGTVVEGDPERHGSRDQVVRFLDFDNPVNNDFLVINQFRMDMPGTEKYAVPDLVLFVNGIPLVVVECKTPTITDPMEAGITQLLLYSNQRDHMDEELSIERLFRYNQLLVSTFFDQARVGTIGSGYEHFMEWKDTAPVPLAEAAAEIGERHLSSQQKLISGMLRPAHLLDIVRNFLLFRKEGSRTVKLVAHYQQFRAVHAALQRLQTGVTKSQHGETDQRGGIVWHTQGSGKSLTMVFLVRKMRTLPALRKFKVVVVTDRTDLERQLRRTAILTGETVRVARKSQKLQEYLAEPGADLVFGMIQKYQEDLDEAERDKKADILYPVLNTSENILVLVDEAHRSHTSALHANLMRALPNCTKIGFTGTPILAADKKRTMDIFGEFIDRYTLQQSEADGSTVPILYEGYDATSYVDEGGTLDQIADKLFAHLLLRERQRITEKYVTTDDVLEAMDLIAAKARHMLRHYITTVLPNGLKAQIVAVSRLAAVRYQQALVAAHREILEGLETLSADVLSLTEDEQAQLDDNTQFLLRAYPYRAIIKQLEFAAVISPGRNDPGAWADWTDKARHDVHITRFKKLLPSPEKDPQKTDGLAILVVKSMLLTGFDAPVEQALYLDRKMEGHELLQAVARVNRTAERKTCGLVVDYCGIMDDLQQALAVYSAEDIEGALTSIRDTLPILADRQLRVMGLFHENGIPNISQQVNECVDLLHNPKLRADFAVKLKQFLQSLDIVLPRPEALPFIQDAKTLGLINKIAQNRYRDAELNLIGAEQKVRQLIDRHIRAHGIDPKVPPISITDVRFMDAVQNLPSPRSQASEMEHAARYHIATHFNEDPARYKKLSERLEEIVQALEENWEELVTALREFIENLRQERQEDTSGLDPRTQVPFLGLLVEEVGSEAERRMRELIASTVEMVDHIQQEIRNVGFWKNEHAQRVLNGWVAAYLDDHDLIPLDEQPRVADRIMALARTLHAKLVSK